MRATEDLTGRRFGRLVVIELSEPEVRWDGRHNTSYVCRCDCGKTTVVAGVRLKNGNTRSCGCLHKESIANLNKKHGDRKTRLYSIWCRIKQRCKNPHSTDYQYYGGKGISICDDWAEDYLAFKKWSLDNGYDDSLTIDRIDVEKNYEPNNCRWVSRAEQANNRTNNRVICFNGKEQTLMQWAREVGIDHRTISRRIDKLGWSVEKALTTKVKPK